MTLREFLAVHRSRLRLMQRRRSYCGMRLAICALATCVALHGQTPAGQGNVAAQVSPSYRNFDVVSIKPNKADGNNLDLQSDATTYRAQHISLKSLIADAYGLHDRMIFGIPEWALKAHWDISAKIVDPGPESKDRNVSEKQEEAEYQARLKDILAERFHLKVHDETRTVPIFDLEIAKADVLKLSNASADKRGSLNIHNMALEGIGIPVSSLIPFLTNETGRNVVDKTGLTGLFDMHLRWTREDPSKDFADSKDADAAPNLFTALKEQMGLKLVSAKGSGRVVVVDSVEMPSLD